MLVYVLWALEEYVLCCCWVVSSISVDEVLLTDGFGTSLVARWLRLHTSNAWGKASIPGWGTKILLASMVWPKKRKRNLQSVIDGVAEFLHIFPNFLYSCPVNC